MQRSIHHAAACLAALSTLATAAVLAPADANAGTSATVTHVRTGRTGIKVVGLDGAKVSIDHRGNVKTDSVPAIFNLYTGDAYVYVTVKRYGSVVWRKKVEVRAKHQTVISLNYRSEPSIARRSPSAPTYVGTLRNTTGTCKASDRGDLKFEFLRNGRVQRSFWLKQDEVKHSIKLAAGSYQMRVYIKRGNQYAFRKTYDKKVSKDGWDFKWGCKGKKSSSRKTRGKTLVNGGFKNYCLSSFKKGGKIYFGANPCSGKSNQKWQWPKGNPGWIKNTATGYCLAYNNGGKIQPQRCNNSRQQKWSWRKVRGWWQLSPASAPGACLGINSQTAGNNYYWAAVGNCRTARTSYWTAR